MSNSYKKRILMVRIVKLGAEGSWSVISSYDGTGVTITNKEVEFRVEYTVDTNTLSVCRKYVVADGDNILWEGDDIDKRDENDNPYLVGFSVDDFKLDTVKGRIEGRDIMVINHYLTVEAYIIDDMVSDNEHP